MFICGRTCAGKDTQAENIIKVLGDKADRISTGDIYRGARNKEGEYAKYHDILAPYFKKVDKGRLVPDKIMVPLVEDTIANHSRNGKSIFIFTGFPRTKGQLKLVDEMTKGESVKFIFYDVSEETAKSRVRERVLQDLEEKHRIRNEDLEEGFNNKLKEYRKKTLPILRRLRRENRLIIIDAERDVCVIEQETSARLELDRRRV